MTLPKASPETRVELVTDVIAGPLATFFRTVWAEESDAAGVRRAQTVAAATNPLSPGELPPAVAFLHHEKVIGYIGTIPVKFWNGQVELPAHWLKGFMVLPEHRNGPVGFAVLKELLKHVQLSGITSVALPARRLFGAANYVDCGVVPNFITPLRAARIARSVDVRMLPLRFPLWVARVARFTQMIGIASAGGAFFGAMLWARRTLSGIQSRGLQIEAGGTLPSAVELNELWERARPALRNAAVRDGTFLPWRYETSSNGIYEGVAVRSGVSRRLVAIAIVRRPKDVPDSRLRGIRTATLSDILFPPNDATAGVAAVSGAEQVARRMGADALLSSASHPVLIQVLQRRGAIAIPGNIHLMLRDKAGIAGLSTDVAAWWVTRGDAGSDEAF